MPKILVRLPNWIGDTVMALPAINNIASHYKNDRIALLSRKSVLELFKEDERFYKLYCIGNGKLQTIIDISSVLRQEKFDTAILLQNAIGAAIIAKMSRIPERIGYKTDFRRLLLTKPINLPEKPTTQDRYFLNMLKEAGIDSVYKDSYPLLNVTEKEMIWAERALEKLDRPIILFFPGAAYGQAKRWPWKNFTALAKLLYENIGGTIILIGSDIEKEIGAAIETAANVKNQIGKTTLRETMALLSNSDLLVTNDSGPMHVAAALGTTLIGIYGSTDPERTPPVGNGKKAIIYKNVSCSPCFLRTCPTDLKCMKQIGPSEVFETAKKLLF